jgi:Uma2 family endonuclease
MTAAVKRDAYEELLALPEWKVGEIVDGVLYVHPRPASPHAMAASAIVEELGPPFKRGRGGPGGWIILFEPELHLGADVLVPDLAGWRRERMPHTGNVPYFTLAPDWVCEVLSPSTRKLDRGKKLAIYGREGVRHAWLVDPIERTLEVLRREGSNWMIVATHQDDERVRAEPFDAIELELSVLWADVDGEADVDAAPNGEMDKG